MTVLRLTQIGISTGIVIPKEMLSRLKAESGDCLYAIETPEGYLLTSCNPAIQGQLDAGRDFMKQYSDTFKALAKVAVPQDCWITKKFMWLNWQGTITK